MSHSTVQIPAGQPVPEPGVEPDGIDTPTLAMWGFLSVVIVVGVMFGSAALYFSVQNSLDQKRLVAPAYKGADDKINDQVAMLNEYKAPTKEGDPYIIPIGEAKKLVLADLQSDVAE